MRYLFRNARELLSSPMSTMGRTLDIYRRRGNERPIALQGLAVDMLRAEPGEWRMAAQFIGVCCARSIDDQLDRVVEAAALHVGAEHRTEFREAALNTAMIEALRAWQWMTREWSEAADSFPWLSRAHEWLSKRDEDALADFRLCALVTVGELSDSASHDVIRDAVISRIESVPESARDSLAAKVREHLRKMNSLVEENSNLALDDAFIALLESIGADGKAHAAQLRSALPHAVEEHGTPYYGWLPSTRPVEPPRRLDMLAKAVWRDVVEPTLKREAKRLERNAPALTYVVHEDVTRIHSRAYNLEDRSGQRALVFDDGDPIVLTPAVAEDTVAKLVNHGAALLGSVTAHRALRWEVSSGYERVMRGEADARTLTVEGGWTALAETLGMTKAQHIADLRAIVHAQAAVMITLPDGTRGNMLALRDSPAVGRRRGRVEIVLGTMLLPHYIYELEEDLGGRALREAKRLVPIANLPPFVGRANDHGAQATASMLLMRELRARAAELYREGAVRIGLERWAALFHEAGAPASIIGKVLDRWTRDGSDGPAFLASPERGAYTLADAYSRERAFLLDAGKREAGGREAGKRSVQKREAERRRVSRSGE